MALKKSKKIKENPLKDFKVNVEDTIDYGDIISDTKVVSEDRDVEMKVVLQTFIGDKKLVSPKEIDMFISNSIQLAEEKENFIPWIPKPFKADDFILKCIEESSIEKDIEDEIDSSRVITISDDFDDEYEVF